MIFIPIQRIAVKCRRLYEGAPGAALHTRQWRPPRQASLAAVVSLVAAAIARGSIYDTIGLTPLLNMDPSLTGAGVNVAQVEDTISAVTNTFLFETNPAYVGQPDSLFTYILNDGSVSPTFSPANESGHADLTGAIFFGTASGTQGIPGVAPGVSHVDNYFAGYFFQTTVPDLQTISAAVVNQSFGGSYPPPEDFAADTAYDNYVALYGTIFVSGIGNNAGTAPAAPSSSYNGIAAGSIGGQVTGPTADGRSKPDIVAPESSTSYSTALVSGSAAILVQAGARGDGGDSPATEADAVDFRTVKALLLNGADKYSIPFTRTPDAPLDPNNGAGMVNVYNSYMQLIAGKQSPASTAATTSVGGPHAPVVTGTSLALLNGWDFNTLTSSPTNDVYANYLFTPPAGTLSYSLTATMDWERQFNPNTATPLGINTFGLYLYDATSNLLVDWSNSAVDNVQDVFDNNLIAGHQYDLEVLKNGGAGAITNSETYAAAFTTSANPSGMLPSNSVWTAPGGGSWAAPGNWYNGNIPEHGGQTANFTDAISAPQTITLDAAWFIYELNFYNTNSYTIAAGGNGGEMLVHGGGSTCHFTDSGGNQFITAPAELFDPLEVTVVNSVNNFSMTGPISGAGSLTLSGAGSLILGGSNSYSGGTVINSGTMIVTAPNALPYNSPVVVGNGVNNATLILKSGTGTTVLSSLQINPGSLVDIGNKAIAINYGAIYNDPIFDIVNDLSSGYNGGAWTGASGIISSAAQKSSVPALSVGYTDGAADADSGAVPNQVLIKYTLVGDTNLDGLVNFADLVAVLQNYDKFGTDWAHGDFMYGDITNFSDLVAVLQNFNKTLPSPSDSAAELGGTTIPLVSGTDVQLPEPTMVGLAALAGAGLLTRRRRKMS